ncbi:MAG: DNA replication/repair protein RecF [Bacillota bacterium]
MYLEKIHLKNFRNIQDTTISLNSSFNFFIGKNGQGKTNLLESIYLLGTGKSHRTNIDKEMIKWNKDSSLVQVLLNKSDYNLKISLKIRGREKKAYINGNPLEKISELLGNVNVVLFSPEDLQLVKGSPSKRRKFINIEVSQVSSYYHHLLNQYRKVLKQRNNLLKEIKENKKNDKNNTMLEVWNEQLIDLGSKIIEKRLEVIDKLKILARLSQRQITGGNENLSIFYESSLDEDLKNKDIRFIFKQKLVNNKNREIRRGYTLFGPHRADLMLKINNMDVRKYGSQGQQRTVALALKLAELEYMKSETGEYPILLLDDVFSELDKNRKNTLINSITDKIQTLITSTEIKDINKLTNNSNQIFSVKNGNIAKGR